MSKIIGVTVGTPTSPKRIADGIVDQTYDPQSENAQSGKAISGALQQFAQELKWESADLASIKKVTLEEVTYEALWNAVKTHKAIMFDTLTERFTGAETELNLPLGCYVAFYEHGQVACWHFNSGVIYTFYAFDLFDTGDYTFYVESPVVELQKSVGDIDTALDNINKELNGLETLLASI